MSLPAKALLMKIKGIVFDFDGMILGTETPELKSYESTCQEYGIPFPIKEYEKNIGSVLNDNSAIQYLAIILDGDKILQPKFLQKINDLKSHLIEKEHVLPSVLDYLKEANSLGLYIGLASSSDPTWINYHINRLGLRKHFYCILTKDDVEKVKPFLDIYLLSLSRLGLNNSAGIVLNSFSDISLIDRLQRLKIM